MNNEVFQKVFDELEMVLPEEWNQVILFVAYSEGSYSMKYYLMDNEGVYKDCFKQTGGSKMQLVKVFLNIDKILSVERKDLDEKNKWSVMTMIVNSNGKMKTEFDYIDVSESMIPYEEKWKEKYINS